MRAASVWVVSVAAAVMGVLLAHAAAYAIVPSAEAGAHSYLPVLEAATCAVLAAGVAAAMLMGHGRRAISPTALAFAVVPPAAFLLQEVAERNFVAPVDPVVVIGLLLQIPFAVAAYVVAILLLRLATAATAPARPRLVWFRPFCAPCADESVRPLALIPRVQLGRAPPVAVVR